MDGTGRLACARGPTSTLGTALDAARLGDPVAGSYSGSWTVPHGHPTVEPRALVSARHGANQGVGRPVLHSSVSGQFGDAVRQAELFGFDTVVGDVNDEQGTSIFGFGNIVLHDPYQHSELMRSRRDLRLKRGTARAVDRRTGVQSHEGP